MVSFGLTNTLQITVLHCISNQHLIKCIINIFFCSVCRPASQGANKVPPNEEDVMSNFDFLQNEDEEEVNLEDDGGNADDESDDRDDEILERRVNRKNKQGMHWCRKQGDGGFSPPKIINGRFRTFKKRWASK